MTEVLDCGCVFDSSSGDVAVICKDHAECRVCAANITEGYSWNGLCAACAEPHLNPDYQAD